MKIPTAEELFYQNNKKDFWDEGTVEDYILPTIIEFAKLHVEAALKQASEEVDFTLDTYSSMQQGSVIEIDKETVIDAYPLTNIK